MSGMSQTLNYEDKLSTYEESCKSSTSDQVVLFQNITKFYTDVLVNVEVVLRALLDSGSMTCTISEAAEQRLQNAVLSPELKEVKTGITLVGCGGVHVQPKCMYQLKMVVYGHVISVPTLVVPGQQEDLILGTNVIKYLIGQLKQTPMYWRVVSKPETTNELEVEQFLNMLSGLNRWKGDKIPDVVGTVKLTQAVTLLPKHEHLVWGKLPASSPVSAGSAILVEPPRSPTHKKNVMGPHANFKSI